MKITRLRDKLLLSAVVVSLVVTLASMLAVSWVISRQYLTQSDTLLHNASAIVNDSIAERKSDQLNASRQVATQKNLGSTIWYLAQYAHSNLDRETLFNTYQQLVRDTYKIGRVANLSRIAIYDAAGNLVSFALFDKAGEQVGFVERSSAPIFQVATLKEGEELSGKNMQATHSIAGMGLRFGEPLPNREGVHYAVESGLPVIESDVPIMGEAFDPNTGKQQMQQLGLVVTMQVLDQSFVDGISRLTGLKINVFTPQGFSSGDVAAYRNPDWGGARQTGAEAVAFNEITIDGTGYYQSLIPLHADNRLVGVIAALHSKEAVQKNIREMMGTLGLIAAASLLFIFSFVWYIASSIFRPLTLLNRIFRSVADKKVSVPDDELRLLEKEKMRCDELGDLTQSFMAMNEAVNQKIRQIEEINASLEHKVGERTAALASSEQESRTLIENSPDTIARYDHECRRSYVNPAFGAMTDGGVAALLGKKPSESPGGPNSAIYEAKIREVFANGKNTQFELKWFGKDGKEICSHIRLTAERDLSGAITSVLGVGRDITELSEFRAELNRKELAKTRFLAAAGHDLRQPLAAANLFIDALRFAEPGPEQDRIIQRLEQAMATFSGLLDALLNISKLDAGIITPEYASINVSELMNWLEQNFAPLVIEKKLGFKLYYSMGERLAVRSDIGLLKSVLMNLVSNAIKFTSKGAILVSARRRGDEVLFQVWDTGIGMQAEHIRQIFDEFYQVGNPQRDRTGGLGLGLSIAKRALTLLGGEVACHSRPGRGSVFEFRLPLSLDNATQHVAAEASLNDEPVDVFTRGKHFVVVEDDTMVAQAMVNWLEGMGGEVRCFHRAEDALRHDAIGNADCYIVDYMLGGTLNGIQFLESIRQKSGSPVSAVLMTGDTSTATLRHAEGCSWPILHKPVNTNTLIACLRAQAQL